MKTQDVLVIGGGLGGLMVAARLCGEGRRVTLWEGSRELGGRARSRSVEGYTFNLGPHALYESGAAAAVLRDLGIPLEGGKPDGNGSLALVGEEAHTLPVGPVSLLVSGLMGAGAKLELARLLATLPKMDPLPWMEVPLQAWVEGLVARPVTRQLVYALVRVSSYGHAPALMSAGLCMQQLQRVLGSGVFYLDGGWGRLVSRLRVVAEDRGVQILCDHRATRITREQERWLVRGESETHSAQVVVVATPPAAARQMLAEVAPKEWMDQLGTLEPMRASCLNIALRRLPRTSVRFALGMDAPTYFSVHSASADLAPAGGAVIHLARYLAPGERGAKSPEALETILDRCQPGWREVEVARQYYPSLSVAHAYPKALPGAGRAPVVVGDGLFVVGDWTGGEGMLADATALSANFACDAILAGTSRGVRAA